MERARSPLSFSYRVGGGSAKQVSSYVENGVYGNLIPRGEVTVEWRYHQKKFDMVTECLVSYSEEYPGIMVH